MKKMSRVLVSLLSVLLICLVGTCFAAWNEGQVLNFAVTSKVGNVFSGQTQWLDPPQEATDIWTIAVENESTYRRFFHIWNTTTMSRFYTDQLYGVVEFSSDTTYSLRCLDKDGIERTRYIRFHYRWNCLVTGNVRPTEYLEVYLSAYWTGGESLIYSHSVNQIWDTPKQAFYPRHEQRMNIVVNNQPGLTAYIFVEVYQAEVGGSKSSLYITDSIFSGSPCPLAYVQAQYTPCYLGMGILFRSQGGSMRCKGFFENKMDVYIAGDVTGDGVDNMRDIAMLTQQGIFNQHLYSPPATKNWWDWQYHMHDQVVDCVIDMRDINFVIMHFNDRWFE